MMRGINIIVCFICLSVSLSGQIEQTFFADSIPVIEVLDSRLVYQNKDILHQHDAVQNLGEALSYQSPIFIKNYGPGTLATPSLRGMAANHTAILWKGFNLQSIMNGVFDFSLIPSIFIDDVQVAYGGNSALWGSGAVGGSIHLLDRDVRQNPMTFSGIARASLASFDNYRFEKKMNHHWNGGKTYVKWASFYHTAKNDFPYRDLAAFGTPEKRLVNAAQEQYGTLLETGHRLGKWDFSTWLWWQQSDREIPPSMTEVNTNAFQKDDIARFGIDAKRVFDNKVLKIKAARFSERIYFENDVVKSDAKSNIYFLETQLDWRLNEKQDLNIGLLLSPQNAEGENYRQNPSRTDAALFANFRYQFDDTWSIKAAFRQATSSDGTHPTTFSIGLDYQLNNYWRFNIALNRDFKQATFNDLYWDAPDDFALLPETSWAQELNAVYTKNKHRFSLDIFNINLKNQILWSPQGAGIWRPENVVAVWSRGFHFQYQSNFNIQNKRHIKTHFQYQFVQSTNESNWFGLKGKQLIYTPRHTGSFSLTYRQKNFDLLYEQQLTGEVFTARDNANNSILEAYSLARISLTYNARFLPINTTFAVNNLWDSNYRTIAWRAMPRRNFQFIVKYNL